MKSTPKSPKTNHSARELAPQTREQQLQDIAASGDADNAACAAADLQKEFPPTNP